MTSYTSTNISESVARAHPASSVISSTKGLALGYRGSLSRKRGVATLIYSVTLVMILIVGRWSPMRLAGDDFPSIVFQPRLWLAIALTVINVFLFLTRKVKTTNPTSINLGTVIGVFFFLYTLMSVSWAPGGFSLSYNDITSNPIAEKFIDIVLVSLLCASINSAYMCGIADMLMRYFWRIAVVFATLFIIASIHTVLFEGNAAVYDSRFSVLGGGPNVFGRNMGFFALAFISLWKDGKSRINWLNVVGVALCILLVLLSGSRGALLSTFAGVSLFVFFEQVRLYKKALLFTFAGILTLLFLTQTEAGRMATDVYMDRVVYLSFEERYTAGREERFSQALDLASERPIWGYGLAGYSIETGEDYPHNILLEVLAEQGGVGLILFLAYFLITLTREVRSPNRDTVNLAALCLFFVSSLFSGNLYDSRGVFFFLSVCNLNSSRK